MHNVGGNNNEQWRFTLLEVNRPSHLRQISTYWEYMIFTLLIITWKGLWLISSLYTHLFPTGFGGHFQYGFIHFNYTLI